MSSAARLRTVVTKARIGKLAPPHNLDVGRPTGSSSIGCTSARKTNIRQPIEGQEACHADQGSVLEDALQRLPSSARSAGGYRDHPCRRGYARRRVPAPLLAADLLHR